MPEPLNEPTPPTNDLSSVLEGLTKLSESVTSITDRLDDFDTQIQEIGKASATPEPPAPPETEPKWKPKTWDEFPEKAKEVAQQTYEEIEQKKLKDEEDAKKQAETLRTQIDEDFDKQFKDLVAEGTIPDVKDVKDPNDAGKLARKELFALGIKYNSPDLTAMANLRNEWIDKGYTLDLNIKEPNNSKWIKTNPSPYGKEAPVGSSSSAGNSKTGPTYKEIHGLSMDEMIRRYNA